MTHIDCLLLGHGPLPLGFTTDQRQASYDKETLQSRISPVPFFKDSSKLITWIVTQKVVVVLLVNSIVSTKHKEASIVANCRQT